MKFLHNTPGTLGICLEHSNVICGHQGVLLVSQHDGGTTYGITRVSIVSVQFQGIGINSNNCPWSGSSLCMLRIKEILTETGCIVTESQTLFPLSWCRSCFISCVFLHVTNTKKSHWFQAVWHPNSLRWKFIMSFVACHHGILFVCCMYDYNKQNTWYSILDILQGKLYTRKLCMLGGVYVFTLTLDVITSPMLA